MYLVELENIIDDHEDSVTETMPVLLTFDLEKAMLFAGEKFEELKINPQLIDECRKPTDFKIDVYYLEQEVDFLANRESIEHITGHEHSF